MGQKIHVKEEKKRNYFLPMSRQRSNYFMESRISDCVTVTWKENALTINTSAFYFSFLKLLLLSTTSYGTEYCLISCCSCVVPTSCSPPAYSLEKQSGSKRKPWLCASTVVPKPKHCLVTSQSTAPYWLLRGKLFPPQPGLE